MKKILRIIGLSVCCLGVCMPEGSGQMKQQKKQEASLPETKDAVAIEKS